MKFGMIPFNIKIAKYISQLLKKPGMGYRIGLFHFIETKKKKKSLGVEEVYNVKSF